MKKHFKIAFLFNSKKKSSLSRDLIFVFVIIQLLLHSNQLRTSLWAANAFGSIFKLTTFGESHGTAIGGVIDGCPAGISINFEAIQLEMDRRKPGQSAIVTQRKEPDTVQFLSGIFEGITTGTPIGFVIQNANQKSNDYSHIKDVFRPSHADYTYTEKYGQRDYRGGGRSSARGNRLSRCGWSHRKTISENN